MTPADLMWPQEDTDRAVSMWKAGHSASVIGETVGKSRNAVIGKMHRLGLKNSDRTVTTRVPKKRVQKPKLKAAFVPAADDPSLIKDPDRVHPFDAAIPMRQRKQTWELTSKTCRFPVGVPGASDFFHCGGKVLDGYVYCEDHAARCLVPVEPIVIGGNIR